MLPDVNQLTRGTTNGNREDRNNIFSEDVLKLAFIPILASLLKVKFQSESVFETDIATMASFLVVLQVYCVALLAKKKLVESLETYAEIIKRYVHLCGILSNVLLQMMLIPVLGQIFLGLWVCCFILVTYWLLAKISALPANASDNLDLESNMSRNEEPNGDGFNKAPNDPTD